MSAAAQDPAPSDPALDRPSGAPRTVALGLGANLGDARAALVAAASWFARDPRFVDCRVSGLYRTAPVGGPDQPDYLNAVLVFETRASANAVLHTARAVEQAHHRQRSIRWGPRTLDVDVLAVGDLRSDDEALTLPHPRAWERSFVLIPWADVDPTAEVPGAGPVRSLLAARPEAERDEIEQVAGPAWAGLC